MAVATLLALVFWATGGEPETDAALAAGLQRSPADLEPLCEVERLGAQLEARGELAGPVMLNHGG